MSFFGGDSSSSSSTTNVYNTDNSNLAIQGGGGPAIGIRGNNNNVEMLDAGAINSALGFAERNSSAYADNTKKVIDAYGAVVNQYGATAQGLTSQYGVLSTNLAQAVIDANQITAQKTNQEVATLAQQNASDLATFAQFQSQSESGRLAQLIQWGMVAAVAIFALKAFGPKRATA